MIGKASNRMPHDKTLKETTIHAHVRGYIGRRGHRFKG